MAQRTHHNSIYPFKSLIWLLIFACSCSHQKRTSPMNEEESNADTQYDSEIKKPDPGGRGYILTDLGCLLNGPWQVTDSDGYNVSIYLNDEEISSVAEKYTEAEKNLVFELQRNGSVKYWSKKDYEQIVTEEDKEYDRQGVKKTTYYKPEVNKIKKSYTNGHWLANFKDKTIEIKFGNSALPELNGAYAQLGSDYLHLQTVSFIDSTYKGQKVKLKKVLNKYYDHPWIVKL